MRIIRGMPVLIQAFLVSYLHFVAIMTTTSTTTNRFIADAFNLVDVSKASTIFWRGFLQMSHHRCSDRSSSCLSFFRLSSSSEAGNNNIQNNNINTSNDNDVPMTPCIRICRYNADFFEGNVCIGCFRETYEIATWASMDAAEKYWTLLDAIDRIENSDKELEGAVDSAELIRQAKYWEQQAKSSSSA